MTALQHEPGERPTEPTRRAWEPPTVTMVGKVRDLVHGMGKNSGATDMDASGIRKSPGLG